MTIKRLERDWNRFGHTDPMFSILTHPQKRDIGWDEDEFFSTGVREIAGALAYTRDLGLRIRKGVALDFGCGVGRLTQALAPHFDRVYGVDIAPSMIAEAERRNRHGETCLYLLNKRADLELFDDSSFDFIYSQIVLQHMQPRYALGYVAEFVRLLQPQGVALFQLPEAPIRPNLRSWLRTSAPRPLQRSWFRLRHGEGPLTTRWMPGRTPVMELYWVARWKVQSCVERAGGIVVDVVENDPGNPEVRSLRYCITRR